MESIEYNWVSRHLGAYHMLIGAWLHGKELLSKASGQSSQPAMHSNIQTDAPLPFQVITANMIDFKPPGTYDRIVSIEVGNNRHWHGYRKNP